MSTRKPPTARKQSKRTFTDDQRAEVVALANIEGNDKRTAARTGVNRQSIQQWRDGERANVTPAMLHRKTLDLGAMFTEITEAYGQQALATVASTRGQQAVTSAAIAFDKARLAYGLPTVIVSHMPDFLGALKALGIDPEVFVLRVIERAEREAEYQRLQSTS